MWLKLNNVVLSKEADRIANSVVPDQTAPRIVARAVWSGSTLFAQTCLSKN